MDTPLAETRSDNVAASVLVVDDDALTRKLHASYLQKLGFLPVQAANGAEAMGLLADGQEFTAAIIDWHMSPLNGYAFACAIRADAAYEDLTLVMVTGEDRPDRLAQAQGVGIDCVLAKPLTADALAKALQITRVDRPVAPSGGPDFDLSPMPEEVVTVRLLGEVATDVANRHGCQLEAPLGRGAMAEVFRCRRQEDGRLLALKFSLQPMDPASVPAVRFRREAALMQQLDHPNLPKIQAHGQEEGYCYALMELFDGDVVDAIERAGGRLSPLRARLVIAGCARGLAEIHRAGIIHRDLKPNNILLRADGNAVLSDLGLAAAVADIGRMTTNDKVLGTPAYLPPEAIMGKVEEPILADIYGLGATWFHCLVGRPPYEGKTVWHTFQMIVREPLPNLEVLAPGLPVAQRDLLARCLAKDPSQRPASADELLDVIDPS